MPIVSGGSSVNIDFTAQADVLVAEVKRINKSFDEFKAKQKETASAAKESSKKIAAAAKKQSQSWTEVRSAYSTVLDVMRAGKAVFDFAKEGAQLEFVKQKFENLSESIGTTSEVLLKDLRGATQGMYSDMELMASATDFVGLGLANTADEAVRLATVSAGLNMNMNQLVLTLTNMTTMRFDALGVRVDGFKEKVNALKASGMDADAAFKEAFLQQAEAQLELVGNAADTSAGAFMRFEAQWANTTDTIKQSAGEAFTPILQSFNDMNAVVTKEADQLEMLGRVGLIPTGEYSKQAAEKHEALLLQLDKGALMTKFYSSHYPPLITNINDFTQAAGMSEEALKELSKANADLLKDAISIQDANDKYSESQQEILDTIEELQAKKAEMNASEIEEIEKINEQIDEQKEKYKEGAEAFGAAQGEKLVMLALEKIALQDGVAGYSDAEMEKAELLLKTAGIAEESAIRQALAFEKASSALADGTTKAQELHDLLRMMSEHGWTIDVAVNVQEQISRGQGAVGATGAAAAVGWQGGQWRGGDVGKGAGSAVESFARGGKAGGWGLVGDRQGGGFIPGVSELIFGNARVFNSQQSEKMLKSGMLGKVPGFKLGGSVKDNFLSIPPVITTPDDEEDSNENFSQEEANVVSSAVQAIETQAVEMQSTTVAVVQQMAMQMQQMTQQIIQSNQATSNALGNIANILLTSNPKAVGAEVAYEVSRRS